MLLTKANTYVHDSCLPHPQVLLKEYIEYRIWENCHLHKIYQRLVKSTTLKILRVTPVKYRTNIISCTQAEKIKLHKNSSLQIGNNY